MTYDCKQQFLSPKIMEYYKITDISEFGYVNPDLTDMLENLESSDIWVVKVTSPSLRTTLEDYVTNFNSYRNDDHIGWVDLYCTLTEFEYLEQLTLEDSAGYELYLVLEIEKIDYETHTVLEAFLPYIFNGDKDDLTQEEIDSINCYCQDSDLSLGLLDDEAYFGTCEITGGQGTVIDVRIR